MEKIKVFLAETDEKFSQSVLSEFFASGEIEVVGTAFDWKSCADCLHRCQADVLVIDIFMLKSKDYSILSLLKEIPNAPIVIGLGAKFDNEVVQRIHEMGVSYYMAKPVEPRDLCEKIAMIHGFVKANEPVTQNTLRRKVSALEQEVSKIFISVGIPAHIKGYQFLREAVKLAVEEPEIISRITKQLYPSIADRYNTSASKVERAIRHAIEVAWNRGKIENLNSIFGVRIYGANEKPTNGEFIALVADKMLMDGACCY